MTEMKHRHRAILRETATAWKSSIYEIGRILNEIAEVDPHEAHVCRETILRDEFGMPLAQSRVAMRWAAGEFGEDDLAEELVRKVPASKLAHWSTETIQQVTSQPLILMSRREGRPVKKSFAEASREDISYNATNQGIRFARPSDQPFRSCMASHVIREDGHVYIVTRERPPSRIKLTKRILRELTEEELVSV